MMDWDEEDPLWIRIRNYGTEPVPAVMEEALDYFLVRLLRDQYGAGDIAWFLDHGRARHLGIITGPGSILHTSSRTKMVDEYPLTPHVIGFIKAVWRYPGLQEALDVAE